MRPGLFALNVSPGHELTYEFAGSGGCGANSSAGMSGNRTTSIDVYTAKGSTSSTTTTRSCCLGPDIGLGLTGGLSLNAPTGLDSEGCPHVQCASWWLIRRGWIGQRAALLHRWRCSMARQVRLQRVVGL